MNDPETIDIDEFQPAPSSSPPRRQRRASRAEEPTGRTPPHSIEAEEYLLACCLIDGIGTLTSHEVPAPAFYSDANRLVYQRLMAMLSDGKPIDLATLAQELKTRGELAGIGGYAFLTQISGRISTTAQAGYFADKLRELYQLREIIRHASEAVENCYTYTGGGVSDVVDRPLNSIRAIVEGQGQELSPAEPITAFDYPEANDPNILLGNDDYLGRGGGMLFVSHAGAGKSSLILDKAMFWAIGRPAYGLKCNGPLKSLVVQSEDSRRYIGKISRSFIEANNLTAEEIALLSKNVVVAKVKGVSGQRFFARLRILIAQHSPDLIIINPAYLYAEGDISRSECAQPFLVGLDNINKDEKFGYIIVHHTGKPQPKDNKGKRSAVEDWETTYMGFGSSYFANWPRCSMLLERLPGDSNRFNLRLGKAGENAGVVRVVDHEGVQHTEPTKKIPLRYSRQKKLINGKERQLVYWEIDDEAPPPEDDGRSSAKGKRDAKYNFSDFTSGLRSVCLGIEKRQSLGVLHRKALDTAPIPKSSFFEMLSRALQNGEIEKADGKYYIPV